MKNSVSFTGKDIKNFVDSHTEEELQAMKKELEEGVNEHLQAITELVRKNQMFAVAVGFGIKADCCMFGKRIIGLEIGKLIIGRRDGCDSDSDNDNGSDESVDNDNGAEE